jgi:hypothetical protein
MNRDSASHAFLGEEFLTWLWFSIDREGGEFALARGRVVGVTLEDFIAFAPSEDETCQTLRKGLPTRSPEARTALRDGRRVRAAKLTIAMGELQWQLVVDGSTMGLSSIKLPDDDPEAADAAERARGRAANFVLIHELVEELYGLFLRVRLAPDYLRTQAEVQAGWMAGGG